MPKIILQGFIVVPDADLDAVKSALPQHCELTRQEPGCLAFEVTANNTNPNRFEVYEVFESKADFEAHQLRVKQSYWGQVTTEVRRHYQIEELP